MSRKRVWLLDGHNMIFAIHDLKALQVGGRGEEARQGLAERLEVFALQRQERVMVVFDGDARASGQSAVRAALFEVVFARGGAGAADHFILREARRCAEDGLPVAVVTDDVQTLASKLPRGVRHFGVRAFWLAHVEPRPAADDKRVEGDFSDIERAMLAQAAASERVKPASVAVAPASLVRPTRPSPQVAAGDRRRDKRQRGRLRQARHLKRRGGGV